MTTRAVIQGELGLQSVQSRRLLLRIKFWIKILNMNDDRLVKRVYRERRREFIERGKKDKQNWCYWTWKFLKELGGR